METAEVLYTLLSMVASVDDDDLASRLTKCAARVSTRPPRAVVGFGGSGVWDIHWTSTPNSDVMWEGERPQISRSTRSAVRAKLDGGV